MGHMSAVKTKAEELKETIAELGLEPYLEALDEQGYTVVPPSITRVSEAQIEEPVSYTHLTLPTKA